jgi:hypothetical protein
MNATETTGQARTETRTYKGVTTTSTEVRRTRFYGTLDGHWNVGHDRRTDIGPAIVEVVVWRHEESTGRGPLDDSFSVEIDGEHQWGGFASHMAAGDRPEGLERLWAVPVEPEPHRHMHIRSAWSRCAVCGEQGVYNVDGRMPIAPTSERNATQALADMLRGKVREAMANGATEDEAIAAVRALWLEAVRGK